MKKMFVSVLLVFIMAFYLIGCGSSVPATNENMMETDEEIKDEKVVATENPEEATATPVPTDAPTLNSTLTPAPTVGSTSEPTATSEPTPEPTPTPHTHNYTETVTRQASCTEAGEKTLTCSCGDVKTEAIPVVDHNWGPVYQTVTHPSVGHEETTEVQVQVGTTTRTEYACAVCDARFDTPSEVQEHCKATGDRDHAMARTIAYDYSEPVYEMQTQSKWIVDTSEYTTQELVGYTCSICGATQ